MSALALQELGALSFEPASCGWYPRIEAEALEIFACQLDSSFTCSLGLSKVGSPGGQLALFLDFNMHAKPTCPKLLPSAAWAAAISIQPSTRSMSRGVAARGACHCRNSGGISAVQCLFRCSVSRQRHPASTLASFGKPRAGE